MLELYFAPGTCSLASLIALEEAGARYETVKISFAAEEQRGAAYTAVNPKARVPALVTERGVITETPAILAFVAQSYPAARLAPLDDPFAFAEVQAFNSYLCATVHVAHATAGADAAGWMTRRRSRPCGAPCRVRWARSSGSSRRRCSRGRG